jgi:hypothetical protein
VTHNQLAIEPGKECDKDLCRPRGGALRDMKNPLLIEINTRCWLRELSDQRGATVTLGEVPDVELARWQERGFTHVWLMGVWPTGPRCRAEALGNADLRAAYDAALPGWKETDVAGSPYAIAEYKAAAALGGEPGLRRFRKQLHGRGMKLILDFVPNHLGLDHPWVGQRPELFVQSPEPMPGTFRQSTEKGVLNLAHGRDPHFPPWTDTVQLDYRRPDTREAMIGELKSVAHLCDGVRCDMAMLPLNEVFAQTWANFPGGPIPATEFWAGAIGAVKKLQPEFMFLGEAYWDLEATLQLLGFDFTYDKRLYDHLWRRHPADVQRHLLDAPPRWIQASAHFLENHDEPRIAGRLSLPEHRAAALLILGLPGMRFLHDGECEGAMVRTPVQLVRRVREPVNPLVTRLYQSLFAALKTSTVGGGEGRLLRPRPAWADNPSAQNFVLVQWQTKEPEFDLVVVNLDSQRSQCYAPLSVEGLSRCNWALKDLLGEEYYERSGNDLQTQGLYLDVPPNAAQLFHFQPHG